MHDHAPARCSAASDPGRLVGASADKLAGRLAVGFLCLTAGLHGLQALALGPWRGGGPAQGPWSPPWHLWLLESATMALAAAAAGAVATRTWWQPRLRGAGPVTRARLLVAGLVLVQALLALAFWWTRDRGIDQLGGLRAVFWMGGEFRLPALFAAAQAGLAAALAWQCHRRTPHRAWLAATVVCAYIGVDELLSVHETAGAWLQATGWIRFEVDNTAAIAGTRSFAWLLLYVPLAALVGLALLHAFWQAVGPRQLAWLVLAALTFLGGAVGMELVQAEAQSDQADWLLTTAGHVQLLVEETLETLGMSLAIRVLAERAWTTSRPCP